MQKPEITRAVQEEWLIQTETGEGGYFSENNVPQMYLLFSAFLKRREVYDTENYKRSL